MAQGCNQDHESLRIVDVLPNDAKGPWVDVIALHGLHSTFDKTWLDKKQALSPWLAGLPFTARIFAYDNPLSFSSEQSLLNKSALESGATALLAAISNKVEAKRPLVFLCHNIAGILVKELLWIANHDARYLDIALATRALVLFGVPDMFSSWQDDLLRLALVTTGSSDNGDSGIRRAEVTETVDKGPSALQAATMRFEMIKNQYHIISVREVAPADGDYGVIVQPALKNDLNLSILMPATHDRLPLSEPVQAAFQIILNATTKSRKDYQYNFVACRQKLAAHYQYDGELGKLRPEVASDVVSPLCKELTSRSSGLVTIYGSAGSGKSVLASQISAASLGVVLSFSFSVADHRRSSYRELLLSFLLQLLYRDGSGFNSAYIWSVYSRMTWGSSMSSADLYRLLCALLGALPKTTIIINALDECDGESQVRIVGDFKRIALKGPIKCMVYLTCRPSDAVTRILGPFQAHNSINLDENMKHVRSELLARGFEGEKLQDVRSRLEEANATPLKVSLIATLARIGELSDIPDDYDSIYERILARIDAPPKWLETILLCIAFARRPLTVAELAVAVGLDRCAPRVSGARLTRQQIRVATPKQFQEDLELVAGSLIYIQDNVVYLVHGTLRDFIRYNSSILAQSKPPVHIQQPDAGQWGALCRSLAVLSAPEIRDFKDMATKSRLYDHLCSVPISSQPYSFARYAGSSLVHDLKLANNSNTPEELIRAATDAASEFWDTIETRSWWIETFTTLQGEAAQKDKTPLQTSLYLAASVGIQSAVQKLLPEASDSFATIKMALCPAIRRGNIETTRLLLTTASNFEEDIWRSAIEFSCNHGRAELLRSVLLWRSESTGRELSESELLTCLSHVAGRGHWHIIHALKDAYPQMVDAIKRKEVVSLIEEAACKGRDGVISELLPIVIPIVDSISSPAQSDNGISGLETEVYSGDASGQIEDSVRTERDGAATDTTTEEAEGETVPEEISKVERGTGEDFGLGPAIIKAVEFGNAVAIHLLASISDAILEYRSEPMRMTPLHWAAFCGNTEALIELLNRGADIDSVDNQDATALLFACLRRYSNVARNTDAVNALLERGANPDHAATRSAKYRAVHLAARNGSAALVRVLLEAGASENARLEKPDWDTPLHLAVHSSRSSAQGEYVETVRALLEFGADVNASRGDGSTALHLAVNGAELSKDMVRVLVKFGADIDKLDDDGRSPLHYAVSKQDGEVAKMLWNPSGFMKGSVMFNAAARGNAERVRQLLSAGCDKAEQDEWGRTAYDVSGSAEVRSLLAPPLATSGNSPGDDGEAAAVQATEEDELCPTLRRKKKLYLSWFCDMCKLKLNEEIFYHCCACSSDCEELGTFDMCEKCFDMSDCKGGKHKIVMRFAAEDFTSYEEYSPGIASFGHEVGDRNQEADTVETT